MVARFYILSVLNLVTAIVGNTQYVAPSVVVASSNVITTTVHDINNVALDILLEEIAFNVSARYGFHARNTASVVVVKTRFNGIVKANFFSKDLLAVTIVFVVIVRREF